VGPRRNIPPDSLRACEVQGTLEAANVWFLGGRCRGPGLGGLGILDLKLFGYVLRMRWPWMQGMESDRVWSLLPVKEDPLTIVLFQASTVLVLGDGHSLKFWPDRWLQGKSLGGMAPDLVAAASKGHVGGRLDC
jgi:hypothetical protein